MLCPKCQDVRFPLMQTSNGVESVEGDNSHLRKAHRSAKEKSKQPVTTVCTPFSCSDDTAATDKAQDGNRTTSIFELNSLRQLVSNQKTEISRLQSRLNFVLSFLDIIEGDSTMSVDGNLNTNVVAEGRTLDHLQVSGSAHGSSSVNPSVSCELWSTVVSKLPHRRIYTLQQSVFAAVYVDQERKKRRETSLMVTGLPPVAGTGDKKLFVDLCSSELNHMPDVVSVKRIGHAQGKIQPVRCLYLKLADEVKKIINSAKLLRRSSVPAIRESVYINPNLTKAEAIAANQVRVQRRLQNQRKEHDNATDGIDTASQHNGQSNPLVVPTNQQDYDSNSTAFLNPQAYPFLPRVAVTSAPSTLSSPSSD